MTNQKNEWEEFYTENKATEWYPSEPVIRLLCAYRKQVGSKGVRVLDLGSGNGRHVWLAGKEGFMAYGIDLSENAIKLAQEWLDKEKVPYKKLQSGNITQDLPYEENFFDIVLSYGVLDHMPMEEAENVVEEIRRIIKPGGTLFLKLEATASFTYDLAKKSARHEIILDKEAEKGIIQHYFDKEEVQKLTEKFTPIQVYRDDYRRIENMDKNYQSRWMFTGRKP